MAIEFVGDRSHCTIAHRFDSIHSRFNFGELVSWQLSRGCETHLASAQLRPRWNMTTEASARLSFFPHHCFFQRSNCMGLSAVIVLLENGVIFVWDWVGS